MHIRIKTTILKLETWICRDWASKVVLTFFLLSDVLFTNCSDIMNTSTPDSMIHVALGEKIESDIPHDNVAYRASNEPNVKTRQIIKEGLKKSYSLNKKLSIRRINKPITNIHICIISNTS